MSDEIPPTHEPDPEAGPTEDVSRVHTEEPAEGADDGRDEDGSNG
jgi:hypothetical protein